MILCFDIGATNFRYGVWNGKKFLYLKIEKTKKNIENFFKKINFIIKESNIKKIGIAFPGNIDPKGEILFSPNLSFLENKNFLEYINNKNIDIKIENDANCAALGSKTVFPQYSDILTLTLGTGIGGGIILNDKLLNNKRFIGFEFGHITVNNNGEQCECGKKGCVEAYSSSSGMLKRFNKKLRDFKELYNIAKNGNNPALKIIEEGFYYLGVFTSITENIFAPELIVFTGGVSSVMNDFRKNFEKGFYENTIDFLKNKTVFKIDNEKKLGLLGAARLFN